ncbi:MAG: molybdate ABC transporter permease subunit [Gemmatimonadetes bacterium]|nr:molybdate ABC transporter permease subunit [Gemmatimonadota bacterium]
MSGTRPQVGEVLARTAAILAVGLLLCLVALPLLSLLVKLPPAELWRRLREPMVLSALRLSAVTSLGATVAVVVLGLPVAFLLATKEFRGKRVIETMVELPIVLPPTVAGVGLLLAFGRSGLAGGALQALGITLPFTTLAVVVAQVFVSVPFFVSSAAAGFASVDRRYLDAAATLRAPPAYRFFRVSLPLALPSVLAGAAMSWARALGEFGATITFAGNLLGRTQTMPLAVYTALQTDVDAAVALSVLLVILSFTVLFGLRLAPWASIARIRR